MPHTPCSRACYIFLLVFILMLNRLRAWSVFQSSCRVSLTFHTQRGRRLARVGRMPTHFKRAFSSPTAILLSRSIPRDMNQQVASALDDDYQSFKDLATMIREYDTLYYEDPGNSKLVSDDEYDALVAREEELCLSRPDLRERWEAESGLGVAATRFGGRVGPVEADPFITTDKKDAGTLKAKRNAGSSVSRFIKRKHLRPMLSLDNVHDTNDLEAWLERIRKKLLVAEPPSGQPITQVSILTEPKMDGLSLSLRYEREEDGGPLILTWASTRGDGNQGQDVTAAVGQAMKLPLKLPWPNTTDNLIEIRGEVVMPQSVFANLVSTQNVTFSNARNAASGILLRKDDGSEEARQLQKLLQFYAYDIVSLDKKNVIDAITGRELLSSLGFTPADPVAVTTLKVESETLWNQTDLTKPMLDYHEALARHRMGQNKPNSSYLWGDFDMDGCVHKVSEPNIRQALGVSNRAPRWAIAHKFEPLAAVTELLDIIVQVGRTGSLTPVAVLRPTDIAGVTVKRATLHNHYHMQQVLGQGGDKIPKGSQVVVRRAGDVIPQVVSCVGHKIDDADSGDMISLELPSTCPACGSPVVSDGALHSSDKENTSLGQVLRCNGPALLCPPRALTSMQHTFSRDALDVTGLSTARIQQLFEAELIERPSDVFKLANDSENQTKLQELEGWGEKSVDNLVSTVTRVATDGVSLSRFIYSLGIRYAGLHSSSLLAACYGSVDAFLGDLDSALNRNENTDSFPRLREDNEGTKGIGPVLLSSLTSFAEQAELVSEARLLSSLVKVHNEERVVLSSVKAKQGLLTGLSVVFTGAIPGMTRSEAKKAAIKMGASSTPGTVSKSTGLVVAGLKGGKKLDEARQMSVRVMDAADFIAAYDSFSQRKAK